jgi:K+-sensing histidine kinase KdpD
MTNNNDKRHLNISDLEITVDQLVKLCAIGTALNSVIAHDLGRSLLMIQDSAEILLEMVGNVIKKTTDHSEMQIIQEELKELKEYSEMLSTSGARAHKILRALRSFRRGGSAQIFISKPYTIIHDLQSFYPEINIRVKKNSWKSLEIIYPENILTGIIRELVHNAIKHSKNDSCSLLVNWKMQGSRFQFEVHDNGRGIAINLGKSYLPLSEIVQLPEVQQEERGLGIIHSIIIDSGGNLLFKRSDLLGGTQVFFEFPIVAYYKKGQIHDLTQQ